MRPLFAVLAAVLLPALAGAQESAPATPAPAPTPPPGVEARADEVMRTMGKFLASQPKFALEAEESMDEIPDGEPKVELTNVRRIAVERPGRAAADVTGDSRNHATWYDGASITMLDKAHNVYMSAPAPKTIDETLAMLQDDYGVVLPLADVLSSDPYQTLMAGVTYGRYLGMHLAAGVPCHHLVFAQETIEWQIWIDAGEQPLPRKLLITYVTEPGEPQYTATIRKWKLDPQWTADLFTFAPPDGAHQVDAPTKKGDR